jgi:hypothetical protein
VTDWWSNDPVASSPQAKVGGDWWSQDPKVDRNGNPPPKVDPAKARARADLDKAYEAGLPKPGFARQFLQGATFNTADEVLAALDTPVQMIRQGIGPGEAWNYAKAREDMMLDDAQKEAPVGSVVGQIMGGGLTGGALARAGATAIPAATARLGTVPGAIVGGVADGAALGAVSGFADGNSLDERAGRAKWDAALGGAVGGGLPAAVAAAAPLAAPIASNIAARLNPAGYAERQVARAAARSGQTPDQIGDRVAQAAAEGQGEYRLLDGLDYPGARLGAVVAKNPGEGRTELREFLSQRQEGQGYRIGNALAEGLDAPETAQAATARMTSARRETDNAAFGAVRGDADHVNVTPAVERINAVLRPGEMGHLNEGTGIAWDSVEAALARARSLLTDGRSQTVNFEAVQRARGDIADAVQEAERRGRGNMARLLRGVRGDLDAALQDASPGFRDAMARSSAAAREIEAVDLGTQAASRGRSEDKIAAFQAMTPGEQAGFRTGYADPLIAGAQGAAEGVNKARPFTSLARQTELPAFAAEGRGDTLMRQLGRENEMFANRAQATGGSSTAENLADNADTAIDPGILVKLFGGNFTGATRDLLMRGAAALNGNTEAVRNEMARLLMEGDRNRIVTMLVRLGQQDARRGQLGALANRTLLGGGLPTITSMAADPKSTPQRVGTDR